MNSKYHRKLRIVATGFALVGARQASVPLEFQCLYHSYVLNFVSCAPEMFWVCIDPRRIVEAQWRELTLKLLASRWESTPLPRLSRYYCKFLLEETWALAQCVLDYNELLSNMNSKYHRKLRIVATGFALIGARHARVPLEFSMSFPFICT